MSQEVVKKTFQVYVNSKFYSEIITFCNKKNISISKALRIAIKEYINEKKEKAD